MNVGMAWGSAAWISVRHGSLTRWAGPLPDGKMWTVLRYDTLGTTRLLLSRGVDKVHNFSWTSDLGPIMPAWFAIEQYKPTPGLHLQREIYDARGWPLRSMRCKFVDHGDGIITTGVAHGGLGLKPNRSPTTLQSLRGLPLMPIWPGFAVNTLSNAAVLWMLIAGSCALQRLLRRVRGLCPACAYPMGDGAVCTECGKSLPKSVVSHS